MNLVRITILVAAAVLGACSDKGQDDAAVEDGSLTGKVAQVGSDITVSARETTEEASSAIKETLQDTQEVVNESVITAKEKGSEVVASTVAATNSLVTGNTDSDNQSEMMTETLTDYPAELVRNNTQEITGQMDTTGGNNLAQIDETVTETATAAVAVLPETESVSPVAADNIRPATETGPEQLAAGKNVYSQNCMSCHTTGATGAPKIGETAVWESRIAQGMNILDEHAIKGFKGNQGYMPPKGGFSNLNDDEVKAAVAYMVSESQ